MEERGWNPEMALGIPLFDEAHQALAEQIDSLMDATDEEFRAGLDLLIECLDDDFRHEEALMETIEYPGLRQHREQHARVLASLHQLDEQDIAAGKAAVRLVLPWFHAHLATADTALARALQASAGALPGTL